MYKKIGSEKFISDALEFSKDYDNVCSSLNMIQK